MKSMELVNGLSAVPYVYEANHELLAADAGNANGPNIGRNGCNLTITFLSMNRVSLSEKLLRSVATHIPDFAGKVLIIDNGSAKEEITRLNDICSQLPFSTRLVELGKNWGVGNGRNKTIEHLETEWVMFLDNDIYFIRDPLASIQKDIATLGCHFISLPLLDPDGKTLFAKGGNIYVGYDGDALHVGAGSASKQTTIDQFDGPGFLSTFLFGGACVVKKSTFSDVGAYDPAMFVGFEDIDFSIRLFQQGYKVGTCGAVALVHDHPKPTTNSDIDYERTRFTRSILRDSAAYLEQKHGFDFWSDGVDFWLDSKHSSLALNPGDLEEATNKKINEIRPTKKRPLIGLVIDSENWAFANIANQITKYLSGSYDFKIIPTEVIENINQVLMMAEDCDLIHFFWRESINLIRLPAFGFYADTLGLSKTQFRQRFVDSKIITSAVYDHLFLSESDIAAREYLFNDVLAGYTVSSQRLFDLYNEIPRYRAPTALVEDGVDLTLFRPKNLQRFDDVAHRPLIIGWVGNSKWSAEQEDYKGFHSILKPVIEQLQREGLDVAYHYADRQEAFIAHQAMPDYYAQIDVYVCPSKIEGTPNPVLESMACGVPVITTDVGVVPQVFGPLQREFIVRERTTEQFATVLRDLYHKRASLLPMLSAENLQSIQSWDWSLKVQNFALFFNHVLENAPTRTRV